ncbi:MAG: ABC transporter ATP-binding protein, partial [Porphyromonadaceae bacterium]|nr:ABC transporter ATP-binding protein [Porphyromonadaceae bacterium]
NKSLKHLSKLSGNYYSNIKTGNIISILNSDIFNIENFGIEILLSIVIDIITAIATLIILINLQPDLLIIVLVIQLIIIVIQTKFSNKTREIRQKDGDISNLIQEYVSNIMNIVISKSKQNFFKRYTKEQRILTNKCINLDLKIAKNTSEINVMSGLIIISIFGYGGLKIINNELSLGELISFQQYIGLLIMPCTRIVNSNTRIQQALVSVERIFELIDEPIEIQQNNVGKKIVKDDDCTIKFENVSFSYTKEYKNLDGINIVFKPCETTALVGGSGSGKSTIINLIFRMWDINAGEIYINNVDIREYNLKNLRKNISIVTQDSLLFDDTIKNNILLNRKNIEENKFINLCNKLRINEFVDDLEDGFDTIIGENGVKLSGGQKQRLSIARALLGNEKIIIFDEATSA